jgi:hypothetical protein
MNPDAMHIMIARKKYHELPWNALPIIHWKLKATGGQNAELKSWVREEKGEDHASDCTQIRNACMYVSLSSRLHTNLSSLSF